MSKKKNLKLEQLSEDELFIKQLEKKKKRNKWIKNIVIVALLLLIIFILFNVFFGSSVGTKFDYSKTYSTRRSSSIGTVGNDEGMTEFARNDKLIMEYSPSEDLFIFTDIASGKQFRSWPEPTEEEAAVRGEDDTYVYTKFKTKHEIISSPVFVGYTKSGLEGGFVYGINQFDSVKKTVNKIKDGIQFCYTINDISASFVVEFVLEGNAIVMNFPAEEIVEKKAGKGENADRMPRIASISGLLYLTYARNGDPGYYVLPDGSGALTYFDSARVTSYDEYNKLVYGSDMTFESLSSPDYNNVPISMPVYGMVQNNVMITSYATQGETVATIQMGNPGVRGFQYYSMGFKFQLRRFYYTQTSKNLSSFQQLETELSVKSVQQKTYITVGEEGKEYTYVDVANQTRDFLLEKWGGKTLASDAPAMNIKVFLGAENTSQSIIDKVKVMTTFEEVKEIYHSLESHGVTDMRLSLLGWQNNGYYGLVTKKYPVDKDLGGKKDLKELTAWAKENNVDLSFENNMIMLYGPPSSGNSLRKSVIKEPGTSYLKFKMVSNGGVYRTGTNYYVLSPSYYNKKFLKKDIRQMTKLGVENVDLLTVGDTLMTDYNKFNARLREQVRDLYTDWIRTYGENFDKVSVYYGNEYAVRYADYLLDVPLYASTNLIIDESVPFMQIIYHGLIDYYSEPVNQADDMNEFLLKSVEYGAMLSYELTYTSTEELKYTYYNTLFRSQYDDLVDDIETNKDVAQTLKSLRTERITNHFRLTDGVEAFCTEYSNGTKIYVNYEATPVTYNGIEVPAQSFVVG